MKNQIKNTRYIVQRILNYTLQKDLEIEKYLYSMVGDIFFNK